MYFEELVKKISPKLKAITHRLNGRFTFFNDEDLFQEAVLHLWLDFNQHKLDDKTDSYILQGCYFHLKNYIRTVKEKRALVSLDAIIGEGNNDLEDFLPATDPKEYFDYLNNRALIETIRNNGLTTREKEIFNLALSGLTTREIGGKLGISHVRVVKLGKQLREKCRKHLDKS